jgi:hypothetical protein
MEEFFAPRRSAAARRSSRRNGSLEARKLAFPSAELAPVAAARAALAELFVQEFVE